MSKINDFDMEEYINKRMLEITNLDERTQYKKIVGEMLCKIYYYVENAYQELEQRVLNESNPMQSDYSIYLSIIDRAHFDETDDFMTAMQSEDTRERQILYEDIEQAIKNHESYRLYSAFFQTSASNIYRILKENRTFYGVIKTENREYKGTFCLRRNEVYLDLVKDLYDIFITNYQSWTTVCEAYLMKILDVYLIDVEEMKKNEVIKEVEIDFQEYSSLVRYHMIPIWNLKQIMEKTSTYPEAGIDRINYEHQIFKHRLISECEYLVMNTDVEITNIRRLNGDLLITCPVEKPMEWKLYQVNKRKNKKNYPYPILSNQYKESFSGSITEMYRKSIKTKAEMARLIEAFPYVDVLQFAGYELTNEAGVDWEASNYNMDGFMIDEIRIGQTKQILQISFVPFDSENYLNEDIMSFLVTQIQKLFPEYLCIGKLV